MRLAPAILLLSLAAAPAWSLGIAVSNLDSKPHRIGVRSIGGEERVEPVEAGATIYIHDHDPWLKNLDDSEASPVRAEDNEEYAIWKNGRLELQKYNYFSQHHH